MKERARVVIIGGGIVGCGIAFHLAKMGWRDIVVVEQGRLFDTGGSTSHSPGLIFQSNSSKTMTELAKSSVDLYKDLEVDGRPGFSQVGSLEVAWTPERWEDLKRKAGLAMSWGLEPALIGASEAREKVPILTDKLLGAVYLPTDGVASAVPVTQAMGKIAQGLGATFYPRTTVTGIEVRDGRVQGVVTDRGRIQTEIVVSAAGIWGPLVGRMAGVSIPLVPMEHLYVETGPLSELAGETAEIRHPIMRHQDRALYFRQWGERYAFGSTDHEPMPIDPEDILSHEDSRETPAISTFDPPYAPKAFASAVELIPCLQNAEMVYSMGGLFSFTPDAMPLLGESDEVRGFWSAEAVWVAHAGGIARAVAEWIVEGSPSLDLRECDINRFHPHARTRSYSLARGVEQYSEGPQVHHPLDQMYTSRDMRLSPFHARENALGAVFFESAGWEIPQWYEANGSLLDAYEEPWRDRKGWAARNWSPIVGAEHRTARERAAIFDVTAITKLEVEGPGTLAFLQHLTANQMDQPVGRVTYTSVLDEQGAIMCDLTVTRLETDRFMVMTSTGYGYRDLKWFRDHMPDDDSVSIEDVSSDLGCLCLWGPRARDIMAAVSDDDFSNYAFPYRGARYVTIVGVRVLAIRLSYVGELGWELYVPNEHGAALWDALWEAGRPHGLIAAGSGAFTSMRIEKGYRLWGTDIHTEYNPYEAGLGFAVRRNKGDFIGEDALVAARKTGIGQMLCCLTLEDPTAVVMGSEPMMLGDQVLGFVTSADYGYTIGKGIVYGYLPIAYSEPGTRLDIMYFNERYPATVVEEPLYDPDGAKMRA
jgi:glycine cleavage system aminomethyltransferase T/glycine/D-amino acid oxidase-like deaminating enzyme